MDPKLLDFSTWDKNNPRNNLQTAFGIFSTEFRIPQLLDVEDMITNPDEKSMMVFSSMIKEVLEKRGFKVEIKPLVQSSPVSIESCFSMIST